MKNYILIGVIVLVVVVVGYLVFQDKQDDTKNTNIGQSMTEKLCEEQGGNWSEMEILRDEGHDWIYQCECPNNGLWIREGTTESCK